MSTPQEPIVVTGATGKQGGATARRLLADGRPVRALVRDPGAVAAQALADAGARLVTGDLDDPASLVAAFSGAAGVLAVPPVAYGRAGTDVDRETARGRALADAAAAAGVGHVVFTGIGSLSGDARVASGKVQVEAHLRERVPALTVLRPVRFMSNYLLAGHPLDGIDDGVHRHIFAPDVPVQMVAVRDVAEFAAMAFADPTRFAGRTVELAGDDPTPVAAAAAITEATGVPVRYRQLSASEAAAINPEVAEVRELWERGARWHADVEVLRIVHPGLRTLEDWLAETGADALRRVLRPAR